MNAYIALLRGINVGGHNRISMAKVRSIMEELGYESVVTYLQSGNVVFQGTGSPETIAKRIEGRLREELSATVGLLVIGAEEFLRIYASNPFLARTDLDAEKLHATILSKTCASVTKLPAMVDPPEECVTSDRSVYLYCPLGYRNTKLSNTIIERTLGLSATTRNWRTMSALAGLLES